MAAATLADMARSWVDAKMLSSRATNPEAARATRRDDLCRAARAITMVCHGEPNDGPYDLDVDWGAVSVDDLDADVIVRALGVVKASYAPATTTRTVNTLRAFTRWLVIREVLKVDPCAELSAPRASSQASPSGKYFTPDEIERIGVALANPTASTHGAWPARDVAVLSVLVGCGPRASEVAGLRVADVDNSLDRSVLRIVQGAKGGKTRQVPLPRATDAAIATYLAERDQRASVDQRWQASDSGPLFVREVHRGGNDTVVPIDRMWLYRLIDRGCRDAGVPKRPQAAVHATRHSFGVELARRRVPEFLLQQLMGHADPRTTSVYTRFTASDAIDALDDAGWL